MDLNRLMLWGKALWETTKMGVLLYILFITVRD